MRLINCKTLDFGEFFDDEIPPYVILSHRWGKDEVSYHEFIDAKNNESLRDTAGYVKISNFCKRGPEVWLAKYTIHSDNAAIEWAWVDTCCIDKKSSAELSEAINSMFSWYRDAKLCCVYLADYEAASGQNVDFSSFVASRWFKRG